jgi:paraquat-inducible protein B
MISFKDYATKHNISYEAVRKQVIKYEEELKGHVILKNKTRFFDDFAESFMDEHRGLSGSTTIFLHSEVKTQSEEIETLKEKVRNLTEALAATEHKLNVQLEAKEEWAEERAGLKLLADKASGLEAKQEEQLRQLGALETECKQLQKDKTELTADNERLAKEKAQFEKELLIEKNSYVKTWFGLWKRKSN